MKYKIIHDPKYTNVVNIGIELCPDNEVVRFFFTGLILKKMPYYLSNINQSIGFGEELCSIQYFHEMDWEDKLGLNITKDDVCLFHQVFGETVINKHLFENILFDYFDKIFQEKAFNMNVKEDWLIEVKKQLNILSIKKSSF
jgi:hypothetical protein